MKKTPMLPIVLGRRRSSPAPHTSLAISCDPPWHTRTSWNPYNAMPPF